MLSPKEDISTTPSRLREPCRKGNRKSKTGDNELAQQEKVLVAKPEDLSSIPRTYTVEEDQLPKFVLSPLLGHAYVCAYMHANTQ